MRESKITHWKYDQLGNLADILDNKRKPVTKSDRVSGEYPYYGATGVLDYVSNYLFDEKLVLVGEDGAKWGSCENTAFIVTGKCWVNNHAHVIRPNRNILLDEWLVYYLNFSDLLDFIKGVTVPKLNQANLRRIAIPLPSIEEQKRIVSILDDIFMDTERAKEIAVTNRSNTLKLYQSSVDKILFQKSASDQNKNLNNVCIIERGSSPRPIKKYITSDPDGVNWIKIGDTKEVAKYITSTTEKITKKGAEKSRFVDIDDLIISNSMSFGKPYIMKIQGYIHDGWFVLRPFELINTEYLWYLLVSQSVQTQIKNLASGAIVKNIRSDLIKQVTFPVPSLEDQKARLMELNELSDKFEDLEKINVEKVESWDNLKKSVLNKAFRGEL